MCTRSIFFARIARSTYGREMEVPGWNQVRTSILHDLDHLFPDHSFLGEHRAISAYNGTLPQAEEEYVGEPPFVHDVLARSAFHGSLQGPMAWDWYHAFITLITVLSYLLLIFIAGLPYNYGQMKDLSLISSATSSAILCLMLIGLATLAFCHHGNPKMPRMPDTLVNTSLFRCSSRFIEGFKGRSLTEVQGETDHGTARYWFKTAEGVDGAERWMVDAEGDQSQKRLLLVEKVQHNSY